MPQYAFLLDTMLETESLPDRLAALRVVGVPYSDEQSPMPMPTRADGLTDTDAADG